MTAKTRAMQGELRLANRKTGSLDNNSRQLQKQKLGLENQLERKGKEMQGLLAEKAPRKALWKKSWQE